MLEIQYDFFVEERLEGVAKGYVVVGEGRDRRTNGEYGSGRGDEFGV